MDYDIIIKNCKIIDGTGNPWYNGEIGIHEGHIVDIKRRIFSDAQHKIDAKGKVVCPGFIDIHSHSDYILPFSPRMESSILQGITTHVIGMCGEGLAPIPREKRDDIIRMLSSITPIFSQIEINWSTFNEYLSQELENMKSYVREAMEAGAFGMSTGLIYDPQVYGSTKELIELAKVVAEYDGLYFSHIRGEGKNVLNAVKECIEIVEKSGVVGGQIAHHKIAGKRYWGLSENTIKIIEEANEKGISIYCDSYPYTRGMTSLKTALPPRFREGGDEIIIEKLKEPKIQKEIIREIEKGEGNWENFIKENGFENIFIASVNNNDWKEIMGKNISEITNYKNLKNDWKTFFRLLIEDNLSTIITIETMDEKDITRIITSRFQMFGTDGLGLPINPNLPKFHPRCFGTYPRNMSEKTRF
ncbi:MAG: N-acyl-D-amino-acid deacylase family protein [Promethearchaeota archaeon]